MDKHNKKICAGIVLYNPEISLLEKNITSLLPQVDSIFLFDNASDNEEEIGQLLNRYPNIFYIRNKTNEGIAYALNRVLDLAEEHEFEWCLMMDQDSICSDNLITEYSKYIDDEKAALICPFVLNNGKYTLEQYRDLKLTESTIITKPIDCITSASLNNVLIIKKLGKYNEDLFIDCVDNELNCRVLQNEYKIIRANRAYLIQSMGTAKNIGFISYLYRLTHFDLFRRMQTASVYSDIRLYYQSRNSRYVRKKYKNAGFRFSFIYMFLLFGYFTLFYPADRSRIKMWKSIIKGFHDYKKIM